MKKIISQKQQLKTLTLLITLSLMVSFKTNAQINYENTYSLTVPMLWVANLGNNNYKYVIFDYNNNNFSLYNLNHTPYMLNIIIPTSTDSGLYKIGYITTTLFDCDSTNIEYALMPQGPYYSTKFWIYRTDGTLLFSKDSVTTPWCYGCNVGSVEINGIVNTPAGAKLFLFNAALQVFVYGLCGSLPENITEINQSSSYVKIFPNPASHQINFEIIPPSNYEKYELTIFNSEFQTFKTNIIDRETKINLNSESMSSGTYFYSLQNKNKIFQTGKFEISK